MASRDFVKARAMAKRSELIARITGKHDGVLSLAEVRRAVQPGAECYIGCRAVPLERIVGSEGRAGDFSKSFLPKREFLRSRWERVDQAYHDGKVLPPVRLIEVGGMYFVRDGNHRVSVARSHKVAYIDAEISRMMVDETFRLDRSVFDAHRSDSGSSARSGAA